jgi:hypothetical protein
MASIFSPPLIMIIFCIAVGTGGARGGGEFIFHGALSGFSIKHKEIIPVIFKLPDYL